MIKQTNVAHASSLRIRNTQPRWLRYAVFASLVFSPAVDAADATGWHSWRGPEQSGMSRETGLPDKIGAENLLWSVGFSGQSTAVIANGRLYINGYWGEGADLQEGLACFDAETGKEFWRRGYNDFLSDTIYLRYSTSSPTVDAETGNVYYQGSQGIFACFDRDGKLLWQHSLMEKFGRMTFPNSRTASPVIDADLVITRGITSNWGAHGPAGDRFYAFDKKTGELVWASAPADRPKDNSFSHPILGWLYGKRVLFAGAGDGSVVCLNARTGNPIWRVPIGQGGVNATVLHAGDKIIAIHGSENLDTSEIGRMVALKIPTTPPAPDPATGLATISAKEAELWRNELSAFTSSPILVGTRVYQTSETGELCAIDAATGKILWKKKIGVEQRNASLVRADGKLYVPILDDPDMKTEAADAGQKGAIYVIKPADNGCEILSKFTLDGRCFGTPTVFNGKVYVQTTRKLYCFGKKGNNAGLPAPEEEKYHLPAATIDKLQIIPAEVLLRPSQTVSFRAHVLDNSGHVVPPSIDAKSLKWASYIPPTAKVKATMRGAFNAEGKLVADPTPVASAGAFEATLGELKGYIRGRVLPDLPIKADFETFDIAVAHETEKDAAGQPTKFAYPPLPWIGARFKFEVRERDGSKVLTKTIDNKLFQRAVVFLGHPDMKEYTIEADVLSDGNKRKMSEVGLINQRYFIILKGNAQELEVNSNLERLKVSVPFKWSPNEWYRLKTRVDVAENGSGVVRAKAWKRGEAEPGEWTIKVEHKTAHQEGSPGLFGFSPQEMRVYIDNVSVTKNEK